MDLQTRYHHANRHSPRSLSVDGGTEQTKAPPVQIPRMSLRTNQKDQSYPKSITDTTSVGTVPTTGNDNPVVPRKPWSTYPGERAVAAAEALLPRGLFPSRYPSPMEISGEEDAGYKTVYKHDREGLQKVCLEIKVPKSPVFCTVCVYDRQHEGGPAPELRRYPSDVQLHYRESHLGFKYCCNQCGKRIARHTNLVQHIARYHTEKRAAQEDSDVEGGPSKKPKG